MAQNIYGRTRVGIRVPSGGAPSYDADAQAFFTANSTLTDISQKNAINQFYIDLKSYSLFTKMLQFNFHFLGNATRNAINGADPTKTITYSSGWTYSSSGATPNGTSAYIQTGIIPSTESFLQLNSTHFSYYGRSNGAGALIGGFSNSRGYLANNLSGASFLAVNSTSSNSSSIINSEGFFILNRNSSTTEKLFKNGNIFLTLSNNSTAKDDGEIYIGALSRFGSVFSGSYSSTPCSFSSIGLGLTDTEASNLSTAVNTMMTTLGINV
jgi:hypothetical protein